MTFFPFNSSEIGEQPASGRIQGKAITRHVERRIKRVPKQDNGQLQISGFLP